jgi:hypothetical protein
MVMKMRRSADRREQDGGRQQTADARSLCEEGAELLQGLFQERTNWKGSKRSSS